ncbi:MAG: 4Fe-4S dicluster domain-containing protein, partial [bacterium]
HLGILAKFGEYDRMDEEYNILDCFECGACTYVCPSNIPLVQYFRVAKGIVRERKEAA